jgi:hypothetical protein
LRHGYLTFFKSSNPADPALKRNATFPLAVFGLSTEREMYRVSIFVEQVDDLGQTAD